MTFMDKPFNRCVQAVSILAIAFACLGAAAQDGEVTTPAAEAPDTTPLLRRLTEAQYRASIADIFGDDIKVAGRFEPDLRVQGLLAAGASAVSVTPGGFEQYETMARSIAEQIVDPAHRGRLVGCGPTDADPAGRACATAFFERVGFRLYRRPLGPSEVALAVTNAENARKLLGGDFYTGVGAALAGMLSGIEFIFQIENDVADPNRPGVRTLDAWSRASRLSYLLWNSTPDAELLQAAQSGALMSEAGLAAQTDRLMKSPRFVDGARAFFDDYLRLEDLNTVTKDGLIYPGFRASATADAREQTLRTLIDLLITKDGDFRDMLTTRQMPINGMLSPLYRAPVGRQDWTMVEFKDDDPRAGILTQVAFLAGHSHPGRSSPTLRGKAILEILLCEEVPAPPANVNFTVVQDVSNPQYLTTRQRVQAHLDDEECASCHKRMDPMGLALEKFDGAGQFRAQENGAPIDTLGEIDGVKFDGAVQLGQALRDNPKVKSCLVETAFRYAVGRQLTPSDDSMLSRLNARFATSGYRVPDLIRAIATSPDYYRVHRARGSATRVAQAATRSGGHF
ncbi:DUF1592 domain-containing protein [Sphingobium sp. HWE2-09]|uniref:DUF1592 domain-containing protein n=1 Tax=Sphingobium sp. HWE2-09 TaxID=3108390 RepID=UPI002DC23C22|nr:DUF1588 domain-containing protein [Sphingobium sp. HWE2-09]